MTCQGAAMPTNTGKILMCQCLTAEATKKGRPIVLRIAGVFDWIRGYRRMFRTA